MKFSTKLSLTIFITGLIALILLSFAIYKFNYDSVMISQSKFTESIAIEIAEDIDNMLSEKIKTALTLANSDTIIQTLEESAASYANLPDEKRKESIKQLNEKWIFTKDSTDNFILGFTDNKAAQFLKRQQTLLKDEYGEIFLTDKFGALAASTSKLSTFAHGHKYWWLGSYNNGKGAVFFDDRGYDDSVGGYVLGLVVPVKKGNEIIGILKCNLNILGNIAQLITGPGNKLIGNSKLTRSGGRVVFENGFEPLSTQIHHNIFEQLKNNNQGAIIINDSKDKYLVGFSQIKLTKDERGYGFGGTFKSIDHKKGNKGESWYVLCYRQMSVIQAPLIESIKSILLTGFAVIVILLLVSYLFGKKIAQPLSMINKATQKIGKGNFEYRIDISQNDEFGNLGRSFNQIADKLQHTTTSIELFENELAERKQAEKAIAEKERFLSSLLHAIPIPVFFKDREGIYQGFNNAYEAFMGRSGDQMIGKSVFDISPMELAQIYHAKDTELFDSGGIQHYESKVKIKTGETRDVFFDKSVYTDNKGKVIGLIGTVLDITERKLAEQEREKLIFDLEKAAEEVKQLSGLLPICSFCKKIRDDKGYWNQIESYIHEHSDAEFSHGICQECAKEHYPDMDLYSE
jgi:PAS domain S-box-containing protein